MPARDGPPPPPRVFQFGRHVHPHPHPHPLARRAAQPASALPAIHAPTRLVLGRSYGRARAAAPPFVIRILGVAAHRHRASATDSRAVNSLDASCHLSPRDRLAPSPRVRYTPSLPPHDSDCRTRRARRIPYRCALSPLRALPRLHISTRPSGSFPLSVSLHPLYAVPLASPIRPVSLRSPCTPTQRPVAWTMESSAAASESCGAALAHCALPLLPFYSLPTPQHITDTSYLLLRTLPR
ncbi:hypothetical protein C2E23DRAFT_845655 [Lenzites betulinus]|nr:hypothetical protein C2E23DRAFT_845655 [Lenzites betulinus]